VCLLFRVCTLRTVAYVAGMPWSNADGMSAETRDDANRLLFERLRVVVWMVLAILPVYVAADYYFEPPTVGLLQLEKLILCAACLLVWWATRRRDLEPHARTIGVLLVAAIAATSAVSSNLTGQYATHAFLGVMVALFGATLAPWGAATQSVVVAIIAVSVLWNVRVVTGSFSALISYAAVSVAVTWLVSVYFAWLLEDTRRALWAENFERERAEAALREEAAISTALAHVGEELIAAVNTPALLERLSQLTIETVGCDRSWTVLRARDSDDMYTVAAHAGFASDEVAAISVLPIPHAALDGCLTQLDRQDVLVLKRGEDSGPMARLAEEFDVAVRMYAGVRRGGDLIGYHAAAYRAPERRFDGRQERLLRGITHLASMALETVRLMDELNRVNRFRSDFVANMSHELRTPLHVILGYHELLCDGAFGPLTAPQVETLQRTDQRARELLDLINATLDLSRVEGQSPALDARDVCIPEVLDELARETATIGGRPGLQWEWKAPPTLPTIRTDPVKLRMVLKNLVQNAIKFTPAGTISVQARANGEGVEFEIADTGIGISKDAQARIFEPFVQIEASGRHTLGGAGLGLAIVRRLLDMLGGRISVQSEPGHGSTFRVWLPFDVTAKAAKLA